MVAETVVAATVVAAVVGYAAVTSALFTVGCGQVQQFWTVPAEQRVVGKIRIESSSGEHDKTNFQKIGTTLLEDTSRACSSIQHRLRHTRFGDDTRFVSFLGNLDGTTLESFRST